ncbi:hypothetical protein [Streptomyces sp. NPDC051776]|uniref:hypothetical protein n=1 Tax=Streptomyces sp. NPDC051776 TaxID=3155414 RepID=UPI0034237EB3
MDIVIDPPRGVAPVLIGMPFEQALEAGKTWGEPNVSGPYAHDPTVKIVFADEENEFEIVVHLEDGKTVTAVELWRFRREDADVRVLDGDLDIFRTPAREVLDHLASQGCDLDLSDLEEPVALGLTLAFTRDTGREVPRDPQDGHTLYFESVLVGDATYYT